MLCNHGISISLSVSLSKACFVTKKNLRLILWPFIRCHSDTIWNKGPVSDFVVWNFVCIAGKKQETIECYSRTVAWSHQQQLMRIRQHPFLRIFLAKTTNPIKKRWLQIHFHRQCLSCSIITNRKLTISWKRSRTLSLRPQQVTQKTN